MAFRGRGRGRGRGGGSQWFGGFAKAEPFVAFPENVELPGLPKPSEWELNLIKQKGQLERFWKLSPYFLENESVNSSGHVSEIERYSDRKKPELQAKRESLSCYLKLTSSHFPVELIQGTKRVSHKGSLQWDPTSEKKALDLFERLEQKHQGDDEKPKKGGADEAEAEEEEIIEEEEEESDDDYCQNVEFDDDDDDLNLDEGDDDEPCYE